MTHRERMLATLRGEPTDQIPWAPRMDLWYIAQSVRGTLPPEFEGLNTVEIARHLGVACHTVQGDFTQPGGGDNSLAGLGQSNHRDFTYRVELRDFEVETDNRGGEFRTRIKTPAGEITTHLHRSLEMAENGISLPYVRSYPIESARDFEAIAQIFEHLEVIPTPEAYAAFKERVGDQGLAIGRGPGAASPMHLMLHDLIAVDQFFYLWFDEQQAMQELAERMAPFFHRILDAVLATEAEVVFWGANYDQNLTSPSFFDQEIVPWLKMASDRLHQTGKLLLTHTDGENQALLPHFARCGLDIAESVCNRPMVKCDLNDMREAVGPSCTVWGGIPAVALMDDAMSRKEFVRYMDDFFAGLGTGDHLILGVSDDVPPEMNIERLHEIKRRVEDFGPVVPPSN